MLYYFFFFQAEDGIRDYKVTGVQTCALPIYDKEFFRGAPDSLSTSRYVLYWGQEYRNSFPLGHMAFLNIKKQVPPSYTSVIGSDSSYDFPLNTMAALEARKQGGLVSYVHPIGQRMRDVFDTTLGAKEMPVGTALGA